jgi:hypothetical protein
MSVNVTLDLRVTGLSDGQSEGAVAAIAAVLKQHDIAREIVLSEVDGEIRGTTPYPMIISRAWQWKPIVEADLAAAVAAVAPAAAVSVTWDSPDEA